MSKLNKDDKTKSSKKKKSPGKNGASPQTNNKTSASTLKASPTKATKK